MRMGKPEIAMRNREAAAMTSSPALQDDLECLATFIDTELRYCGDARAAAGRCDQQRQQQAVDETLAWLLGDGGSPYREACRIRPNIAESVASLRKASLSGRQREGTGMRPRSGPGRRPARLDISRQIPAIGSTWKECSSA